MISPDGKLLAFLFTESTDPLTPANRIAIMAFEGGEPFKTFDFEPATTVVTKAKWSNDGTAILYTTNANNVTNLWAQPIDGARPNKLPTLKSFTSPGLPGPATEAVRSVPQQLHA